MVLMQRFFHPDSPLMKFMTWIERMLHVQFLWIISSLLGLIVGGLFPATAAMFATMRRFIRLPGGFGVNDYFKEQYKENFWKANGLGYLLLVLLYLFIQNFRSAQLMDGTVGFIFVVISFVIIIILAILFISVWATLAHFDLGIIQLIKHTLVIYSVAPVHVGAILILLAVFGWASYRLGILLPLVLFSMMSYAIMWLILDAIKRIDARLEARHIYSNLENKENTEEE